MRKKIKIIDLLCYISTGDYDMLPRKFKCEFGREWFWNGNTYQCEEGATLNWSYYVEDSSLNDEVEILDEEPKVTVEMTEKEYFKYLDLKNLGNRPVKDEEDEFEDIEELNLDTDELLQKVVITAQDYVIEGKINELIKNQKKIIERLQNENSKDNF